MSIQSLPFEVICRILELGAQDFPMEGNLSTSSRYTFLRLACLISRHWQGPGQSTLWRNVRIYKQATAHKWLASPGTGQHATWDLELRGVHARNEGVSATLALRIVRKCYGVRRLELRDFGRLSCKVLESPSLSGLTNLVLLTAFPDNERVTASLQVPFRLRELHLYNRLCDASLIDVLFSASTSTLATLDLSLNEFAPGYPGVVRSFPLVAPSLHHLSINHRASPELIAHLHLCNQLSVLDCHSSVELAKVLDTLPHPLAVLGLQLDYNLIEMVAIICPRLTQPSLAGLRRLRIPGASWSLVAASQLMSDCAQRGVVLEAI